MLFAGFLFAIFMEYVRPGAYVPLFDALRLSSIVPLAVLIGTVLHKSPVTNREFFTHRNTMWLLFFLGLLTISVFTAEVTEYSFKIFKVILGYIFYFYIIVKLVTTKRRLTMVFATLVISHVLLLILNPQLITDPATRSYIQGNAYLGDGNDYSLSVSIVLPMCLYLLLASKSIWLRVLWGAAMLALILAIVGTQSRGASIALAVVFLYLWWKGRQKAVGLVLIAAIIGIIVSFAPEVYFERMGTVVNYEEEGSAMGRIMAWKVATRMAIKYPISGVGSGHFPVKLGTEFRPPEFGNQNLPWLTAHSMYFLLLGELGVPGIVFLLAMLAGNYLANSRMIDRFRQQGSGSDRVFLMLNASLIAFAVGGAFLSVAYYPHLYVLSGIWTAAYLIYSRSSVAATDLSGDGAVETGRQTTADVVWKDTGQGGGIWR